MKYGIKDEMVLPFEPVRTLRCVHLHYTVFTGELRLRCPELPFKSSSAEPESLEFSCFAMVVIFGLLGFVTQICYSVLHFRDEEKY